mmetsp:Transcript_39714/g.102193  ORF Transcript_39714/g.102193 Transcript_39714/m.102193 type:complete len:212 (+) Transcript_39714:264-899(+)
MSAVVRRLPESSRKRSRMFELHRFLAPLQLLFPRVVKVLLPHVGRRRNKREEFPPFLRGLKRGILVSIIEEVIRAKIHLSTHQADVDRNQLHEHGLVLVQVHAHMFPAFCFRFHHSPKHAGETLVVLFQYVQHVCGRIARFTPLRVQQSGHFGDRLPHGVETPHKRPHARHQRRLHKGRHVDRGDISQKQFPHHGVETLQDFPREFPFFCF